MDAEGAFEALAGELPTAYADRVGQQYADSAGDGHRKIHGLYLTPPPVAAFMASLLQPHKTLRLLDPAAGAGILLCAAVEQLIKHSKSLRTIELVAYEIDHKLANLLRRVLDHLTSWADMHGVTIKPTIHAKDFILANAAALLPESIELELFLSRRALETEKFHAVIANPPYFKIGKNDPRALAAYDVVHGQPNIYGLFMAVSAALLQPGGNFVFITPRSFASGPYFRRFRERFFSMVRPLHTHIFVSRKEAFGRDGVLQENIILHAASDKGWNSRKEKFLFVVSSSAGGADLVERKKWSIALTDVIDPRHLGSVFRLPASPEEKALLSTVDSWTGSLRAYGLNISTGPVVPFRSVPWLSAANDSNTVPLLWMNHIRAMHVHWPNGIRKPQHIINEAESLRLLVPNKNYVLLRRFSAKEERRRLTAAPLLADTITTPMIGLENHLNYIHRPGSSLTENEAWGLAALYNSKLMDGYFRCINGNTQVSATELRAMPLPPLDAIARLGHQVKVARDPLTLIDRLVWELAGKKGNGTKQRGRGGCGKD